MDSFKFTCWNIEYSDKLIDALVDADPDTRARAEMRRDAIREEISALDADVLLVEEGPNGEDRAHGFFGDVAPGYRLITRGSPDRRDYGMKGNDQVSGRQWIWFLIRSSAQMDAQLLHLDRWQELTDEASNGETHNGSWRISYPRWQKATDQEPEHLDFSIPQRHSHWRHPQVLQLGIDGHRCEIIGCHLKSKFNNTRIKGSASDTHFFENNERLVAEVIKARVKITTECSDIRYFINARFDADADAAVIVAGDLNDGPGKERIERRFLYHDLIGELQGDVFFARRFLNHALFDFEQSERWSVFFHDTLDPGRDPRILLDHILFSQSMTKSHTGHPFGFVAKRGGGKVEHEVHHLVLSARPKYAATSDHTPVSMVFEKSAPA